MALGGKWNNIMTRWPCWTLTMGATFPPLQPCWKAGLLAMFSRESEIWIFMHNLLILILATNFFLFAIGLYLFIFSFIFISWRLITSQNCSGFCHTLTWISHGVTWIPHPDPPPLPSPSPPDSSGSSHCTRPKHLSHASNLGWWSVSPLIIYMFWCYSLETSHPRLLPQSPKVSSVHLCLFFCFAYRVIITIFLNSIYMC